MPRWGVGAIVADARSVAIVKLAANVFLATRSPSPAARPPRRPAGSRRGHGDPRHRPRCPDRPGVPPPGAGFGGRARAVAGHRAAGGGPRRRGPVAGLGPPLERRPSTTGVARLEELAGGRGSLAGRRVALLGLAFKAKTDDVRGRPPSPSLPTSARLVPRWSAMTRRRRGVPCSPIRSLETPRRHQRPRATPTRSSSSPSGRVRDLDWPAIRDAMRGRLVYDTRAIIDAGAARQAGLVVERLGRPAPGQTDRHASKEAARRPRSLQPAPRRARREPRRLRLPVPAVVGRAKRQRARRARPSSGRARIDRWHRRPRRIGRVAQGAERTERIVVDDAAPFGGSHSTRPAARRPGSRTACSASTVAHWLFGAG